MIDKSAQRRIDFGFIFLWCPMNERV